MNKFVKDTLSIIISVLVIVGVVQAVNITSFSQTAVSGDKITSTWVNAVNTALSTSGSKGSITAGCSGVNPIPYCGSGVSCWGGANSTKSNNSGTCPSGTTKKHIINMIGYCGSDSEPAGEQFYCVKN